MRRFLFLLLLIPCMAVAQRPFIRNVWLNESNTPVKVNAIIQDNIGYIWLGTELGVYKYTGRSFTLITDSIKSPVTALAAVNDNIYAGYANGNIAEIKNNIVSRIPIYNAIPTRPVRDINVHGDVITVCTEDGVYAILNNVSILLNVKNGLSDNFTYTIAMLGNSVGLVGTDKGINKLAIKGGRLAIDVITSGNYTGLTDNIITVIKQVKKRDIFWVGTQNGGVVRLSHPASGNISLVHNSARSWKWGQVNDIVPLSEDKAWVATEDGYLLNVFSTRDSIQVKPYYVGKTIRKIILGNSGNIWCATSQGITMATCVYLSYIALPAPFSLGKITATACNNDNVLWYALDKHLYKIALTDTGIHPQNIYNAKTSITTLFADSSNGVWAGTFGSGLLFLKDKKVSGVTDIQGLDKANILSITGAGNKIWIASLNGIEETIITDRQKGRLQLLKHHNKRSGIGSDYVYQLYIDSRQRTWMATDGAGICMYDGAEYHHWDSSAGINSKVIYSITEDADSNTWISTLDKGVYFYDDIKYWHAANKKNDLQDVNISAIAANKTGQVIIVHPRGVDEWFPQSHGFRHFNRRFLPQIDSVSSILNCTAKDTAGNVYVPFDLGFMIFNNQDINYNINPYVRISSVSSFLKQLKGLPQYFSYDQNYITIAFDGINYTNPEQLHYRYLLEGYNNEWIYTDDESVTFPQLPPGNYKFNVEVSFNKAFYHADHDSYSFTIATPFWKERWFYLLALLLIAGLIYSYIRWREVQLKKMSQLQKERMQYEYEHLKSQVNPHFLFNSLNTLTHLIEEDRNAAIDYTSQLSDLYRHMLSYRNKDLIILSEEWEILKGYMYVQQSRFGRALQMEAHIPAELLRNKKIVPLALQIVVENAIKHNIVSSTTPLVIYITASDDEIIVRNHLQPKMSKEKSAGLGLANISKRYSLLSKKEVSFGVMNNEFVVKLPLL